MENCDLYYWIRVYDYVYERDSDYGSESYGKGVLLDEWYIKGPFDREKAKSMVREKYIGSTSSQIAFAKPKKKDGVYAIVMDSDKFYFDRFYTSIDTYCFWHNCHKPIKGKAANFPRAYIGNKQMFEDGYDEFGDSAFFCSHDCKSHFKSSQNPLSEGEFQTKEEGLNGNIFGYIYLVHNRSTNSYYIGQTRYMPFFRWQEHIKLNRLGDITDLSFSVLTQVPRNHNQSDEQNQLYLNSYES